MKQKHTLSIMTGFLLISAALITGPASAEIRADRKQINDARPKTTPMMTE